MESPLNQSLDLNCNKFVEASAGAGKTFALSKRYCNILDDFARRYTENLAAPKSGVNNILVITFTKKAAAEMAGRIYSDLKTLLEGCSIDEMQNYLPGFGIHLKKAPPDYKLWLRATFPQNHISTIDSFCASILRENAHLTGLDPQFALEDETLSKNNYETALKKFLAEKAKAFDDDLAAILNDSSIWQLNEYFAHLHTHRQFLTGWLNRISTTSAHDLKEQWLQNYTPGFDHQYLLDALNEIISLTRSASVDPLDKGSILLDDLKGKIAALDSAATAVEQRNFIIRELLPELLTKSGEYRKKPPGNQNNWNLPGVYKLYQQKTSELLTYLNVEIPAAQLRKTPNQNDFRAIGVLKSLASLFSQFDHRLTKKKEKLNVLSFNDLILKTHELLSRNEGVRRKYARRFRHILIDEFQDTNDLRWDIIRMISQNEDGNLRDRGLFIVGDKKQSIYSFLQADVEVMNRAQNALTADSGPGQPVIVKFNENYRSSRRFIGGCINPLFSALLPAPENARDIRPFEVPFHHADYGPLPGEKEKERHRLDDLTTDVCLIQASYDDSEPGGNTVEDEFQPALHTAYTAKKFLRWAESADIGETPVIAVLLRRFTKIQYYLQTFQRYGIPFEITGGRNLFQQQETLDLFHLVSVLLNPLDDFALTGLLRSPVFSVDDETIHDCFAPAKEPRPLYELMRESAGLEQIARLIDSWRELAKSLPLDRLLQQILSSDDREFSYFSEISGGRRIANLDRLIDLIHTLSLSGNSAAAVHEYLEYAIEAVENIPQAEIPAAAKIQFMTIHQAKGLEFPAVIIPEMNAFPNIDTSPVAHGSLDGENIELGLALQDEEGNSVKTGLLHAVMNLAKEKSAAEDARLLYVAVTRAKYRIALLGDFKQNARSSKSWWTRFVKAPGFCPDGYDPAAWQEHDRQDHNLNLALLNLDRIKDSLAGEKRAGVQPLIWESPQVPEINQKFHDLTPHHLMEIVFPAETGAQRDHPASGNGDSLAYGSLYHHAMEKGWVDYSKHEQHYKNYLGSQYPDAEKSPLLKKLSGQLELFAENHLKRIIGRLNDSQKFPECPLIGWIDNGTSFLQVSGRADLLYQHEGKWFCLDYKTDSGKDSLEKYRFQLRTYLWMLKQLYGIDAEGQLYFSHFGETIRVPWDEKYYRQLNAVDPAGTFAPRIPETPLNSDAADTLHSILAEHPSRPVIIVNQTKKQIRDTLKSILKHRHIRPGVTFVTLPELLIDYEVSAKKISPYLSRLLVEKQLAENYSGAKTRGLAEQLSAALMEIEEWGGGLLPEFENIRESYHQDKSAKGLLSDRDILDEFLRDADFSGQVVVLNGFLGFKPSAFEIVRKMHAQAENFYFLDLLDESRASAAFEYEGQSWEKMAETPFPENEHTCHTAFSVDVEVENTARSILAIDDWKNRIDSIKIAAASMEMYVPAIKRIFAFYGIPATILKNEPAAERPAAQLILALLNIMENPGNADWSSLAAVLLHPLTEPDRNLLLLDKYCRLHGINDYFSLKSLFDSPYAEKLDHALIPAFNKTATLVDEISLDSKSHLFAVSEKIQRFIGKYRLAAKLENNPVSSAALGKIRELLELIPQSYKIAGLKGDLESFRYDFSRLLSEIEVPTRSQRHGIEVLGTLDTFHLNPDHLFVLGMIEGKFPRLSPDNPLMDRPAPNLWYLDFALMKKWLSLPGQVRFSAPERNTSGEPLQMSSFLEYLKREESPARSAGESILSPRRYYSRYSGTAMANPGDNPRLLRHNQYLAPGEISAFRGKVKPSAQKSLGISASGMDQLLKCPMRYWFSRVLKITPLKFDEEKKISLRLGDIVHDALCRFGSLNGFELAENDLADAGKMLADTFEKIFRERGFHPADNLLLQKRYHYYLHGLEDADDGNLLVKLLKWNLDNFVGFKPAFFEQSFGMEEKGDGSSWREAVIESADAALSFNGKIDKVLVNDETNTVLASDYKTGGVNLKDIPEFWSSQFPVYYFALKTQFPGKNIILAYEQIKSLRKHEHGIPPLFGEIDFNNAPLPSSGKHDKDIVLTDNPDDAGANSLSLELLKKTYLRFTRKVLNGEFHLAEREVNGKACLHCEYDSLCRKNCVRL